MSNDVYTVTITHEVSDRLIRDIIITACEGGIGYWSVLDKYDGPAIDDGKPDALPLYIADDEDRQGPWMRLGEAQIILGIERILKDYPMSRHARNVTEALALNDASVLDADDCDGIVQCGVLGEITYG